MHTRVFKKRDIPWRIIEGEAIIVESDQGEIIHLNKTSAEIWDSIDGEKTVSDIIKHVCDTFDIKEKAAETDVLDFIKQLTDKKVVKCLNQPSK